MFICPDCGCDLFSLDIYSDEVFKCPKCRAEFDKEYLESFSEEEEDNFEFEK